MTTTHASAAASGPTLLDLRVAHAYTSAQSVAEAWAAAPLNPEAQAAAVAYLARYAAADLELVALWSAEPALGDRMALLAAQGVR